MMAHPDVLARLVEEYETRSALRDAGHEEPAGSRVEDVVYTLCVTTGTRDIDAALAVVRERLAMVV
ncbi:DUF5133 domain-containing protein [Streptomyces sp. NPDC047014]|uniref:DUF5133 domain-containing protein n=1 Tax=Streptomyces sp. NPDC047014 TaxID=3155736 RepID=UPI0033D855AB